MLNCVNMTLVNIEDVYLCVWKRLRLHLLSAILAMMFHEREVNKL